MKLRFTIRDLLWLTLVVALLFVTRGLCCAAESPDGSTVEHAASDIAIFLGCGGPGGPGTVEQFTLDGKPCGKITLPGTAYGLVHRGDSLVAAAPGVRLDGKLLVIHPDGTNEPLDLKQKFLAPIGIALDQKSGNLLVGDNEQNTVSCVLAKEPGEVELLFAAPLTAEQKHYPGMLLAATRDGRIIFSSDDPKGVYRLLLRPHEALGEPLLHEETAVAADPTSMRWVAMLPNELKVFDGANEQFSMPLPTDLKLWHNHHLAFAPDGILFVVLNWREEMQLQRVNLTDRKFTARFSVSSRNTKSIAIGPKFDWNHIETAPSKDIRK
jgi:hypothetical protein